MTATEIGTQPSTPSTRAALAAFEALTETCQLTTNAALRAQAQGLELSRRMLVEGLVAQQEAQGVAEQLASSGRKAQEAWLEAAQSAMRAGWAVWLGESRRS